MNRMFKYALMFCFVAIALFTISQMSDGAKADTHIWDGGGSDELSSTAANWQGDSLPIAGDILIFNTTSQKNCNLVMTDWLSQIVLDYGYNGIVTDTADGWSTSYYLNSGTYVIESDSQGSMLYHVHGTLIQKHSFTVDIDYHEGTYIYYSGNRTFPNYWNLIINGPYNLLQSINVQNSLELNAQWTGRIYYNGTADISTNQQHWSGWLYTQNDIAIEYNDYAYLEFSHDDWLGIQLESWSGTDNFTWNATSVASQTVQWSWSRGEANAMYDEYMDTIYIGSDETNAGGMGEFTSTFNGSHAFLLSRSTFLPASTDIDDSVWLAILFMSIATLINFVGYARKIGLLQIVSFLVLLVGIFTAVDVWEELWTLPTLFILSNAVIFIMGMMRKG